MRLTWAELAHVGLFVVVDSVAVAEDAVARALAEFVLHALAAGAARADLRVDVCLAHGAGG